MGIAEREWASSDGALICGLPVPSNSLAVTAGTAKPRLWASCVRSPALDIIFYLIGTWYFPGGGFCHQLPEIYSSDLVKVAEKIQWYNVFQALLVGFKTHDLQSWAVLGVIVLENFM
jgi:hypothetical protein